MSNSITLQEAAALWLKTLENKAAFFYEQLFDFLLKVRTTKYFDGKKIIRLRKDANLQRLFFETAEFLEQHNLIESSGYRYFVMKNQEVSELEIICSLYPYGYISHLTAMHLYNLTNRFPKKVDFTAPTRSIWKENQFKNYSNHEFQDLLSMPNDFFIPYPSEVIRFKRKKLNIHSRKYLMPFTNRGANIRVIEIGCLFLEMLRFPNECGGFQHVFEVYEEMGEILSEEILVATEAYGNNIDKSRIGYIFEKRLGIDDNRIREWKNSAVSRGGSRKMIAEEPYSNIYDEDWCISLNHVMFE